MTDSRNSVAARFGPEIADRLARIAIDLLCAPPERIATVDTRVPASMVAEGRAILDDAGIDWRDLIRRRVEARREAADRDLARRYANTEIARRTR